MADLEAEAGQLAAEGVRLHQQGHTDSHPGIHRSPYHTARDTRQSAADDVGHVKSIRSGCILLCVTLNAVESLIKCRLLKSPALSH